MVVNKDLLIYVVEDNRMYNKIVTEFLVREGFKNVKSFLAGKECLKAVKGGEKPDIVIQDYHLQDTTGIEVLVKVKKQHKNTEFVFLTANEDMEVAVNSIKYGAFDYIIKDSNLSLKKVLNKIDKISKLLFLQKRNKTIITAMIVSLCVLTAILVFTTLHTFFNVFGLHP